MDVIAVMAGDAQMDPDDLMPVVLPVSGTKLITPKAIAYSQGKPGN